MGTTDDTDGTDTRRDRQTPSGTVVWDWGSGALGLSRGRFRMGPIRNAAFQAATVRADTALDLAGSPTAGPGVRIPVQRSCPARIASKMLALRITTVILKQALEISHGPLTFQPSSVPHAAPGHPIHICVHLRPFAVPLQLWFSVSSVSPWFHRWLRFWATSACPELVEGRLCGEHRTCLRWNWSPGARRAIIWRARWLFPSRRRRFV